jgi:hypothetical protein
MLRNRLEAGDIYVSDSLRFRSFDEDLIPRPQWQQHKERILRDADVPALAQPMAQMLQELETELEARYETVNRRILSGGCWPTAQSTTMPASYRNCSSAPSAGRSTNGPTRSSERTRQAGSM